jgi:hypothetical protein
MIKKYFTKIKTARRFYAQKPSITYDVDMGFFYPYGIRLEASSVCQLKCPSCPSAKRTIAKSIVGENHLKFKNFKKIVDQNSWIKKIELSNWGEIFLNPDLLKIMQYAYDKTISLTAINGVNFNRVKKKVLEALVKYQFKYLSISIDAAKSETYSIYRKRGNFDKVIDNILQINEYKEKYSSKYPILRWQFVLFEHNKNELEIARFIAQELKMKFSVKLSWDRKLAPKVDGKEESISNSKIRLFEKFGNLGFEIGRPISNFSSNNLLDNSQKLMPLIKGLENKRIRNICFQLWLQPQINWDGKILGCCVNHWGDYKNVFDFSNLIAAFSNENIVYARKMLAGKVPMKKKIPCAKCHHYKNRRKEKDWITLSDLINPRKDLTENYF